MKSSRWDAPEVNYRHIYHAGNACDVVKHAALTLLIERLREKEKPFAVLDTHAGAGLYDLDDPRAKKTNEAEEGVRRLLAAPPFPELYGYYRFVEELNQNIKPLSPCGRGSEILALQRNAPDFAGEGSGLEAIHLYPGSPVLIRRLLRPQDRLVACELHPEDANELKRRFHGDKQAHIHDRDGYEALEALLPPPEKRGLVLIDPPFEKPDEFDSLVEAVKTLNRKWPTGQGMIWYPVKERPAIWRFHEALAASGAARILCAEFTQFAEIRHDRLNGCGLIFVNPPWRLDRQLAQLFPALHERLRSPEPAWKAGWLAGDESSR